MIRNNKGLERAQTFNNLPKFTPRNINNSEPSMNGFQNDEQSEGINEAIQFQRPSFINRSVSDNGNLCIKII